MGARAWRSGVPVVCLLAGLLLVTSRESAAGGDASSSGATRLSDLVRSAQAQVAEAEVRRNGLQQQVELAQRTAAGSDGEVAASVAAADALSVAAGLTPLRGEGLTVTLTDAPRDADGRYPTDARPDDLVVHQQDLQSVLNALWAGGADAVSVQDQRVVTTTAPRCIGNTLLLQGRTYSPPYVLAAVGDPARLLDALDAERGVAVYRQYVARYGLGYTVDTGGDVAVPAYAGSVGLTSASVVDAAPTDLTQTTQEAPR